MLAARARSIVREEVSKGCRPEIAPIPVELEPVFQPILGPRDALRGDGPPILWHPEEPLVTDELTRFRVWVSPQQLCDWTRSELMVKQLSSIRHRATWAIVGNKEQVSILVLCHRQDVPVVQTAILSQFERCALSAAAEFDPFGNVSPDSWQLARFCDFYPSPPYSHLLTGPDELQRSPYAALLTALTGLPAPAIGFCQVVFTPTDSDHNWHQNVEVLLDLEYRVKLIGGIANPARYPQQVPSGDLRQMSDAVETKAHNDKPFFAVALRIGVIDAGEAATQSLRSLTVMANLFQHGGRPLNWLSQDHYRASLDGPRLQEMFSRGLTHRPGFLLNSRELASLVHVPPPEITEHLKASVQCLETLPADPALSSGTPIGVSDYAGVRQNVCIPGQLRTRHTHVLGRPGCGKSTVLEHMILHDICCGNGAAVLDPHGLLVHRLLGLIPPEHADRVIYLNPSDPEWVPIWNPLACVAGLDRSRVADDLVRAFKGFVSGWGDRLEHLLRHAFLALLHLPRSSLLDVSNLLRQKSPESRRLRAQLLGVLDNEVTRRFWQEDFERYGAADLTPPQHKLSKLLAGETVSLMLSQPGSAFTLQDVMDSGKILLVSLAGLGPEVLEILGCFILSLLHLTALTRAITPGGLHRPFHIYCDEAHRFLTDAVEDLIAETRKFNVSLTMAHQFMSQFNTKQADALSAVGSTVIFNVNTKDAHYLAKDLQDKVEIQDLTTQDVGQAVARIGKHVVRLETLPPLVVPENHCRDQIIARSREKFCQPVSLVKKLLRERNATWPGGMAAMESVESIGVSNRPNVNPAGAADQEAMEYDEL
jgi:hypothetical protein